MNVPLFSSRVLRQSSSHAAFHTTSLCLRLSGGRRYLEEKRAKKEAQAQRRKAGSARRLTRREAQAQKLKAAQERDAKSQARLATRQQRISLRTTLIRQYEEEERPKWQRRVQQDMDFEETPPKPSSWPLQNGWRQSESSRNDEEVECGIFW